jgi:hypothetical protein
MGWALSECWQQVRRRVMTGVEETLTWLLTTEGGRIRNMREDDNV